MAWQANGQISHAIGVEVANPGGQDTPVVIVNGGKPQPDRAVIKNIHACAQVGANRR